MGILICGITIATSSILYIIPHLVHISHFRTFMLSEAIFSTVVLILTFLFFRSNPPTPPSTSLLQKPQADFTYCITRIWMNPQFLVLWISFGLIMGIYEMLITVLEQLVAAEGKFSSQFHSGCFQRCPN